MTWMERLKACDRRLTGIIAAVMLAMVVAMVGGYAELGVGNREYQAELVNTGGARVGDEVRVAGIRVGEVTGLELDGDRILMTFRVERDVEIGQHARLEVQLATLLGGRHVVLNLPDDGGRPVDRIPLSHTKVPYDLATLVEDVGPALKELDGPKLRKAMTALAESLSTAQPAIADAVEGIEAISGVVLARRGQLETLIRSAEQMTDLVNRNSDQVYELMGRADRLLAQVVARRDLIRSLLTELRTVTGRLATMLDENRAQIQPMLDNIVGVTTILRKADRSLDRALELFAPTARYLTNAVGNGPYVDAFFPNFLIPDNYLCASGAVKGCQ